jgi:hypothetical protein
MPVAANDQGDIAAIEFSIWLIDTATSHETSALRHTMWRYNAAKLKLTADVRHRVESISGIDLRNRPVTNTTDPAWEPANFPFRCRNHYKLIYIRSIFASFQSFYIDYLIFSVKMSKQETQIRKYIWPKFLPESDL